MAIVSCSRLLVGFMAACGTASCSEPDCPDPQMAEKPGWQQAPSAQVDEGSVTPAIIDETPAEPLSVEEREKLLRSKHDMEDKMLEEEQLSTPCN